ncbi:hypothetical protein MNV49_006573 [Pseudohyphozyma bogoriensis]|nr:hypothetical protein MNV49_006573 [Pseudohyphozyma bogoriensis]
MNAPSRYELFVLADGEPKLTVDEDTKIPNAATLTINKEDHTLANMLRAQLLHLPYVLFAGYKVPHPLEPRVIIKLQTDGTMTPIQAVQESCDKLITVLAAMKQQFTQESNMARARGDAGDEGYGALEGMDAGGGFGF